MRQGLDGGLHGGVFCGGDFLEAKPPGVDQNGLQRDVVIGVAQGFVQAPEASGAGVNADGPWLHRDPAFKHGDHGAADVEAGAAPQFAQARIIMDTTTRLPVGPGARGAVGQAGGIVIGGHDADEEAGGDFRFGGRKFAGAAGAGADRHGIGHGPGLDAGALAVEAVAGTRIGRAPAAAPGESVIAAVGAQGVGPAGGLVVGRTAGEFRLREDGDGIAKDGAEHFRGDIGIARTVAARIGGGGRGGVDRAVGIEVADKVDGIVGAETEAGAAGIGAAAQGDNRAATVPEPDA